MMTRTDRSRRAFRTIVCVAFAVGVFAMVMIVRSRSPVARRDIDHIARAVANEAKAVANEAKAVANEAKRANSVISG